MLHAFNYDTFADSIRKDTIYKYMNIYIYTRIIFKLQCFTEISIFPRKQEPRIKISRKLLSKNLGSWILVLGKC